MQHFFAFTQSGHDLELTYSTVDVNEWTAVNDLGVKTMFSVVVGGFAFAVAGVALAKQVVRSVNNLIVYY